MRWGLRSGEMPGCDVQLCANLNICVCPPAALSFGCVCWAGVCWWGLLCLETRAVLLKES